MSEHVNRAATIAATLVTALQDANREGDAVQSLVLLPMIGRARALADDVHALVAAVQQAVTPQAPAPALSGNARTVNELPRMFPHYLHAALLTAGYSVHHGIEPPTDGYWWTLMLPGWSEPECSEELFADPHECWTAAAIHAVQEVTRARTRDGEATQASTPAPAAPAPQLSLVDVVTRMRNEINQDMAEGRVPSTVHSFSALHDHVDANEYGGLCEDGTYAALMAFPRVEGDDPETMPASAVAFVNEAQTQIHDWLAAGRPAYTLEFPHWPLMTEQVRALVARGFVDSSWHNDACPRFRRGDLNVWLEHPDAEQRESGSEKRYMLDRDDESGLALVESDDFADILAAIDSPALQTGAA